MPFNPIESSQQDGVPVSLFRFVYGSGASQNITDHHLPVTIDIGGTDYEFTPAVVTHGAIAYGNDEDGQTLNVRVPADSELARLFAFYPPSIEVALTIYQAHVGDTEYAVRWVGRVMGCSWGDDPIAELACEPIGTALERIGMVRRWSKMCPLRLYDKWTCRASKAAATTASVFSAGSNGQQVRIGGFWIGLSPTEEAQYIGGEISWVDGDGVPHAHRIVGTNAFGVEVDATPTNIVVGAAVSVTLGCNRTESDCVTLHNNQLNYGGQPFMQTDNPIGFKNQFY